MKEKIPVESLVIDKTSKENRYNYYSKKIDENIVLINNNRFTGTEQEQNYVKFLNERYEELSKEREKYAGEINVISQKLLETEMEFKKKATEKLLMLNQFLTEYIQSARNDLGLDVIPIDYTQVNEFHKNVRTSIGEIFEVVEKMNKEDKKID